MSEIIGIYFSFPESAYIQDNNQATSTTINIPKFIIPPIMGIIENNPPNAPPTAPTINMTRDCFA